MASTTSLKLDDALKERLQKLADARKRTPHWLMKEAIERYVSYEEWHDQMWKEANEAIEEYDRTGNGLSHQQVVERIANLRKQRKRGITE